MNAVLAAETSDEKFSGTLEWILRIGLAACFIGHGALGLRHVAAWTPYFAVVGMGKDAALALMPWVGAFDVALAISVLIFPLRVVVLYMVAWTVWTALLRPLAGESFWEAVERAGNYGIPLALWFFLASTEKNPANAFPAMYDQRRQKLHWILRLTTGLLLLGHGALGLLVRKPLFVTQYNFIGLPGSTIEPWIGGFECALAILVIFKPDRWLLITVLVWKLGSEALSPIAGSPVWVFIEHGGSYAAPLALLLLLARSRPVSEPVPLTAT